MRWNQVVTMTLIDQDLSITQAPLDRMIAEADPLTEIVLLVSCVEARNLPDNGLQTAATCLLECKGATEAPELVTIPALPNPSQASSAPSAADLVCRALASRKAPGALAAALLPLELSQLLTALMGTDPERVDWECLPGRLTVVRLSAPVDDCGLQLQAPILQCFNCLQGGDGSEVR